ncbi:ABC transporter permease [Alloscardovia omnicolens]|uniref:ABC transporter permease n=1 Tax=Alloscardovia omnicolens TaxID=419015 RepID=UPI003A774F3E
MTLINDVWLWLTSSMQWHGSGSIPTRLTEHLVFSGVAIVIASIITVPMGIIIGHFHIGKALIGSVSVIGRTIPILGLLTLLGLLLGIGSLAPMLVLILLAIPSILVATYSGMEAVEHECTWGAQAIGMSPWQVMFQVELPLAAPTILGGIRSATLQTLSTATLAAYTSNIGLGRYILAGLKTNQPAQMLGGALLVIAVALAADIALAALQNIAQHKATPAHFSV